MVNAARFSRQQQITFASSVVCLQGRRRLLPTTCLSCPRDAHERKYYCSILSSTFFRFIRSASLSRRPHGSHNTVSSAMEACLAIMGSALLWSERIAGRHAWSSFSSPRMSAGTSVGGYKSTKHDGKRRGCRYCMNGSSRKHAKHSILYALRKRVKAGSEARVVDPRGTRRRRYKVGFVCRTPGRSNFFRGIYLNATIGFDATPRRTRCKLRTRPTKTAISQKQPVSATSRLRLVGTRAANRDLHRATTLLPNIPRVQ